MAEKRTAFKKPVFSLEWLHRHSTQGGTEWPRSNHLEFTLSGRIGKVIASHAEVAKSIPAVAETEPIYTMHEALRGYCP